MGDGVLPVYFFYTDVESAPFVAPRGDNVTISTKFEVDITVRS